MASTQAPGDLSKSSRLVYRAPENAEADLVFFHDLMNDPTIQTMSTGRLPRPCPKTSAGEFIKMLQDAILGVVICLPPQNSTEAGNTPPSEIPTLFGPAQDYKLVRIGHMSLFNVNGPNEAHHRSATIGISLADGFRGKGYGGEAINWMLDWAFQHLGLHRVSISAFSFNHNALKLYRKLGFVDEGREREAAYYRRAWHDVVILSMLEHEWEVLRGIVPDQSERIPQSSTEPSN
ncbi:Acyl-CoA N-acyltransferase [Penicillium expansum]|uniref:Acyl-CoA N-acyltransferase n=1 Tax=Penicillium expansum TaxID=27334 RepID=A0A0A2K968_PENEN|nr:Acyl-CoA N-acyltransferase [Penicillium expansum]KGO42828.1 Acyl-CoA N-acyltransferase [Penicillium expansum]KGO56949.1 Acyl-CoA N-acyltransferase [Penicillium expansum]KGO64382.1 Acyl-CoA N-acyltransferase [Penicillium expansum]